MANHEFPNRPPIPLPRTAPVLEQIKAAASQANTPQPELMPMTKTKPINRGRFPERRQPPPDQGPVPAVPVKR